MRLGLARASCLPSGRFHTACSVTVAGAAFGSLLFVSPDAAIPCAVGALAGVLITPDLDLHGNITYHFVKKYFGLIAYWIWAGVWWLYASVCKHRGFISHFPAISTAGRLLYLGLWILPFYLYYKWDLKLEPWMLWGVLGLVLSDTAHFLLDVLDSRLGGRL